MSEWSFPVSSTATTKLTLSSTLAKTPVGVTLVATEANVNALDKIFSWGV